MIRTNDEYISYVSDDAMLVERVYNEDTGEYDVNQYQLSDIIDEPVTNYRLVDGAVSECALHLLIEDLDNNEMIYSMYTRDAT